MAYSPSGGRLQNGLETVLLSSDLTWTMHPRITFYSMNVLKYNTTPPLCPGTRSEARASAGDLDIWAFVIIHLDVGQSVIGCFILVCRPPRLKSSASSATGTSSSFTAPSSKPPTMGSLPVRPFSSVSSFIHLSVRGERGRFLCEWSWGFYGSVGECQRLREGNILTQ